MLQKSRIRVAERYRKVSRVTPPSSKFQSGEQLRVPYPFLMRQKELVLFVPKDSFEFDLLNRPQGSHQ